MEEIKELNDQFKSKGEVNGYTFKKIQKSPYSYLYEVKNDLTKSIHYEVFKRKINNQFNCVSYPRSKSFGLWAWTVTNLTDAEYLFDELSLTTDLESEVNNV